MQGILHCAQCRLGVVSPVQVVAAAHFQDDALRHRPSPSDIKPHDGGGIGDDGGIGAGVLGISSPPSTTVTVPVPCGSTASTRASSTSSGFGTPMVTST